MKRRDSSDNPKSSVACPGDVHLYSHQPSALLSDMLILDTLLYQTPNTIYFKDVDSRFILNNRTHVLQFGKKNPGELIGMSDANFYPKVYADLCRQDELQVMKTGIPLVDHVEQAVNSKGDVITFSTCKYPLYDQGEKIVHRTPAIKCPSENYMNGIRETFLHSSKTALIQNVSMYGLA